MIAGERIRRLPRPLERTGDDRRQRQAMHRDDHPRDLTLSLGGQVGALSAAGQVMIDGSGVAVANEIETGQVGS